jgi:hypothetical protein
MGSRRRIQVDLWNNLDVYVYMYTLLQIPNFNFAFPDKFVLLDGRIEARKSPFERHPFEVLRIVEYGEL